MHLHDFPVNTVVIFLEFNDCTSCFDKEKLAWYFQILITSILHHNIFLVETLSELYVILKQKDLPVQRLIDSTIIQFNLGPIKHIWRSFFAKIVDSWNLITIFGQKPHQMFDLVLNTSLKMTAKLPYL